MMHNLNSSYPFHNHVNWQLPKQIKQTWKQKINKIKKTGRLRKGLLWYIPFPFILFMIANDQLPRWQEMWRGVWHRPETHTIHTHIYTFKEIHTQWHIKSKAEITHMVKHTHTTWSHKHLVGCMCRYPAMLPIPAASAQMRRTAARWFPVRV